MTEWRPGQYFQGTTMKASSTPNASSRTHPTIGLFASRLGDYYETIWTAIAQVAKEYNAHLLCFVGGDLNSRIGFQKHWNVIYDLASPANLDGIIIPAAGLQNFTADDTLTHFCARYASLPLISIGQKLEGIPGITIDGRAGLHEVMKHLVEKHQCQRIACIRGPATNPEAVDRYRAYIEALQAHNMPFDPELVAQGNFYFDGGAEAISLFLDRRKVDFDAIMASNDHMAVGAYRELTRRGFNIPEDIALTGFDNTIESKILSTPLTTVRQPIAELGQRAARMLLECICNGTAPVDLVLKTELVNRESCGCLPLAAAELSSITSAVSTNAPGNILDHPKDAVLADIQKAICPFFPSVSPQSIEPLVDTFFDTLDGESSIPCLRLFNRLLGVSTLDLGRLGLEEGLMFKWQEVLSMLREKAVALKQPEANIDFDRLIHQGRILITAAVERAHLSVRSQTQEHAALQSEVVRGMNTAPDVQQVADVLAQNLPGLGISTCALAMYEGTPIPPPFSRLLLAFHDGKRLELGAEGRLFASEQLIPPEVLQHDDLPHVMIHPLLSRDIHLGFVIMEIHVGSRSMYDAYDDFSDQIGAALYRAILLQQIRQSNEELQERAAELAEVNAQLEQFAYVASHDLQEPLRMVTSYLQLVEKRYKDKLDTDAEEFIGYAVDGAARMKRMINDLLAYSRVTTRGQPLEPTRCEDSLALALSNLEVAIKNSDAVITQDPLPTVMADSTQLMIVFQNLIENAIKFRADRRPHIHISARRQEDEWLLSIQDNGIGIAPEFLERVFAIFSRLHPHTKYPGTGIGLAICKRVTERHGGHIWAESQPGEGTTFFFTIPALSEAIPSRLA
jgi:signal transduction histidine kinase/DNA-binding LacI/PurR family transcriptional regulator